MGEKGKSQKLSKHKLCSSPVARMDYNTLGLMIIAALGSVPTRIVSKTTCGNMAPPPPRKATCRYETKIIRARSGCQRRSEGVETLFIRNGWLLIFEPRPLHSIHGSPFVAFEVVSEFVLELQESSPSPKTLVTGEWSLTPPC